MSDVVDVENIVASEKGEMLPADDFWWLSSSISEASKSTFFPEREAALSKMAMLT